MSGDPWSILGIESTKDRRAIKRAYAVRLKETRPEDDPEGFQRLHNAYRFALAMIDVGDEPVFVHEDQVIVLNKPDNKPDNDSVNEVPAEIEVEQPPPAPLLTAEQEQKIHALCEQMNKVLSEPLRLGNTGAWTFLTDEVELLDDAFRVELGRSILKRIITYNQQMQNRKKHDVSVPPHIISLLDNSFFWTSNPWAFIEGPDADDVFDVLSKVDPGKQMQQGTPVGGQIMRSTRRPKTPQRVEYEKSSDDYEWIAWVTIWVLIILAKVFTA